MPGREKNKPTGPEALTSIEKPIHCAATEEGLEDQDELDEIDINNFIHTLAEVAMSVAVRRLANKQDVA